MEKTLVLFVVSFHSIPREANVSYLEISNIRARLSNGVHQISNVRHIIT